MKKTNETDHVNIGITDRNIDAICKDLELLLANEFALYQKTRCFHWNVEGKHFGSLHKLFEDNYNQLALIIDEVAERIRQLGKFVNGTQQNLYELSTIEDNSGVGMTDIEMLKSLTADQETVIKQLRKDIDDTEDKYKDKGTADFLTNLMEQHEKMAWMLRAHTEK